MAPERCCVILLFVLIGFGFVGIDSVGGKEGRKEGGVERMNAEEEEVAAVGGDSGGYADVGGVGGSSSNAGERNRRGNAAVDRPRNRIQVSKDKKPSSFFVLLAKRLLVDEEEVELSGLGFGKENGSDQKRGHSFSFWGSESARGIEVSIVLIFTLFVCCPLSIGVSFRDS